VFPPLRVPLLRLSTVRAARSTHSGNWSSSPFERIYASTTRERTVAIPNEYTVLILGGPKLTSRGSRWRQYETNSLNGFEKMASSCGGGFFGIKNKTCKSEVRPRIGFTAIEAYLHRMEFCIWGFSFGQFYGSNTETPYISFMIIATLFDNLRRHPVRCSYECVLLRG
jgi:hypothetical protein